MTTVKVGSIWFCKVGECSPKGYGADGPMREAVARTFESLTGEPPAFIFSGWGGELTPGERAVVNNTDPLPIGPIERDLVSRLRTLSGKGWHPIGDEAANEIERLRRLCLEAGEYFSVYITWNECAQDDDRDNAKEIVARLSMGIKEGDRSNG